MLNANHQKSDEGGDAVRKACRQVANEQGGTDVERAPNINIGPKLAVNKQSEDEKNLGKYCPEE